MTPEEAFDSTPPEARRIIKRYSNRKLYDTQGSTYVTLLQIAQMIRDGEEVQIIDNATKEDKTDVTLALIISEELRTKPRAVPLSTLKALIRHGGERILSQLRGGPIGRLIPTGPGADETGATLDRSGDETAPLTPPMDPALEDELAAASEPPRGGIRATLEHWQMQIDERIRTVLPNFAAFRDLEQAVKRLQTRIDELESRLEPPRGPKTPGGGTS
jgi:polyhydroxyalkanoate synthesis repressor PhaR